MGSGKRTGGCPLGVLIRGAGRGSGVPSYEERCAGGFGGSNTTVVSNRTREYFNTYTPNPINTFSLSGELGGSFFEEGGEAFAVVAGLEGVHLELGFKLDRLL